MRLDEFNNITQALTTILTSKQTASANQAACPAGGVGAAAGGFDTAEHRDAAIALIGEMRSCLIAYGMMKGSA